MAKESNRGGVPMPPSHEKIYDEELSGTSEMPVRAELKSGIEVMATRPGFFQNMRKVTGDKFMVSEMSKVGSWMQCVDPKAEAQHLKMMKEKKSAGL